MSDAERAKRRNYRIVGAIGGFVFPIAGAIGAGLFYANGDRDLGLSTAIAAAAGAVVYAVAFLAAS